MAEQEQSLRALFLEAKALKADVEENPDPTNESYQEKVAMAISKFEECQNLVSRASVFSTNEGLEDIATTDLQLLTVDYLLAEVLQRSSTTDRESLLRRVLGEYEKYLTRLDHYDLLSANDRKLFERYQENPTSFTLASQTDAAHRREVKVARFREEKELKQKLEYLSQQQSQLQADEDITRQLYLAEINFFTHQTFQSLDMISQELSMLVQMKNVPRPPERPAPEESRQRNPVDKSGYSERLDPPVAQLLSGGKLGPLLSKDGKPLQPFTLTDRRTQLRQGVFRPGHNLPTMTIEEYLEEERKRGGIIEGGNNQPPPEIDEDDMEKADEETMKARAWDEFKEEHPRGSGNTLNRG
ncbi:hypothetical protein VTN49DRAFT_5809 [Thermomyces lanuginosus]|uniref:uncharacterized protein n=1 Tax=Thermomyces lanuginosus TaxID=5541 RepID=UPI00374364D1